MNHIISCDRCDHKREINSIFCEEHICGYCKQTKDSSECIFKEYGFTCFNMIDKNEDTIIVAVENDIHVITFWSKFQFYFNSFFNWLLNKQE